MFVFMPAKQFRKYILGMQILCIPFDWIFLPLGRKKGFKTIKFSLESNTVMKRGWAVRPKSTMNVPNVPYKKKKRKERVRVEKVEKPPEMFSAQTLERLRLVMILL